MKSDPPSTNFRIVPEIIVQPLSIDIRWLDGQMRRYTSDFNVIACPVLLDKQMTSDVLPGS